MSLTRLVSVFIVAGAVIAGAGRLEAQPPLVANKAVDGPVSPTRVTPASVGRKADGMTVSEVPPLPEGKATLLGGTISNVDHVRDRLILQVFGGSRAAVLFDERTRVFRDGKPGSTDDLKNGVRAYVDTVLDGTSIFARNVRLVTSQPAGQSNGQVVEFDARNGELTLRDALSPEPVKLRLAEHATILRADRPARPADLQPGTLVALTFGPGGGDLPRVNQISILASPGTAFVFVGRVEHLDLHRGLLVLVDPRDNKSYEVHFESRAAGLIGDLRQGANVTVQATFDGSRYEARSITPNSTAVQ